MQAAIHEHVPRLDAVDAVRCFGTAQLPAGHPVLGAAGCRGALVSSLLHPWRRPDSPGLDTRWPKGRQRRVLPGIHG